MRSVIRDGEIWFVAADMCAVLEQSNSRQAIIKLDDDERDVTNADTLGGTQQANIVNESDVYASVLHEGGLWRRRVG